VDTTAPTSTVTNATLTTADNATFQSNEPGTAYLVNGSVAVTNVASITGAADNQWNTAPFTTGLTNLSLSGLANGSYKLYTVDAAGNLSTVAGNTVTVLGAVIDLPSLPAGLAASKLIAPVSVAGSLYYYWDISGDGSNSGADSWVDHNLLDAIFNTDIDGNTNVGDTTDTIRYATIGGIRFALPTASELSAINSTSGLPTGWANANYWSASIFNGNADYHSAVSPSTGASTFDYDLTQDGNFGNGSTFWVALKVVDLNGPATPTIALATDSGSISSDGITNVAAVNIGGLTANTTWQYQVDGGNWITGTGSSFNLSSGTHTYAAHQVDQNGNVGNNTATATYTLDTTAPTATITDTTGGTVNSGYATFTFAFNETVAGFTAADITVTNGAKGTLTGSGSSYAMDITPVMGSGNMTVGITTGSFTDVAGNANTVATTPDVQPYNMLTQAGQAVIDLGGSGKLIAPIQVEGKWYYFWDRNGDSTSNGSDITTHDVLDAIFNNDINGVTNTTVPNADGLFGTTDTYRYATINGVQVALPTLGTTSTSGLKAGSSASGTGTADNPTYNDMLVIWDALNGTGTGTNVSGLPPGWINSNYHSATTTATGHAYFAFSNGGVTTTADNTSNSYVALQVL
jgi:hypothetical protein